MIQAWVVSFSLVLVRAGTFVTVLPVFGGRGTPRLVKAGLAFALSVFWFTSVGVSAAGGLIDRSADACWLAYGLALGREALLGAVLGYGLGLFLVPLRIAGEFISQEMGLTLTGLIDPTADHASSPFAQILETLGIALFLGLDGHHVFLAALHGTFLRWPLGGEWKPLPVQRLVGAASAAGEWGLMLAAPLVICLFLTSAVLALLARAAPQMNLFTVGFGLRVGVGLVAALVLLPELVSGMAAVFGRIGEVLLEFL